MGFEELSLCPIIYDPSKQKEYIEKLIDQILNSHPKIATDPIDNNAFIAGMLASSFSRIFKNKAFEEEKEWRLIYTPLADKSINEATKLKFTEKSLPLSQVVINNNIRSYFEGGFNREVHNRLGSQSRQLLPH